MQHPRSNATRYRMRKSSGLAGPRAELNSRVRLQATLPYISSGSLRSNIFSYILLHWLWHHLWHGWMSSRQLELKSSSKMLPGAAGFGIGQSSGTNLRHPPNDTLRHHITGRIAFTRTGDARIFVYHSQT